MLGTRSKIIVAVTNDISTDQRVHKVVSYLVSKGFNVTVYGRKLSNTFDVTRAYSTVKKRHWFNTNFLFYAEYNVRLLFFLLKNKSEYILSNDLDTLPACFMASRLKKNELVYDSHEYFTEVPELQGRVFVQNFWKLVEKIFLPRIKRGYTVSESISKEYAKRYNIKMGVIRNVPLLKNEISTEQIQFPTKNKVVLYQGILSENRGLKQTILALNHLKDIDLVIIGYGKEEKNLRDFTEKEGMTNRVHFLGRIPHENLPSYTRMADIGLLLEEPAGLSFKYALPNKLFDYIHCELPILAYPLYEIKKIIKEHKVGVLVDNHEPKHIAFKIQKMLEDNALLTQIKKNQQDIKARYSWDIEKEKLDVYFK